MATLVIKFLVASPFLLCALSVGYIYRSHPQTDAISDLQVEKVNYTNAYIEIYGISRRYQMIEIVSGSKKYGLYPSDSFLPAGMTLEQIEASLKKTTEATIWTEKNDGTHSVRGIETTFLKIPPSYGINHIQDDRRVAGWAAVLLFTVGIGCYIYFKQYFGLDWKLDFSIPKQPKQRKKHL